MKSRPAAKANNDDVNTASVGLLGQALLQNRLPKPEILTFDGDSKRYKIFMASFLTNVSRALGDDNEMKLTLLLQHWARRMS